MTINIHDDAHHYTWRSRKRWPSGQHIQIFVESEKDAAFYSRLIGTSLGRWIQFLRAPGHAVGRLGGGYSAWRAMMDVRRQPDKGKLGDGLFKAYCLIDGEEIARARSLDVFSPSESVITAGKSMIPDPRHTWNANIPDVEGALFLNCYEIENLYLLHTDILDVMWRHWGDSLIYFGEKIPQKDSWKVLQRTLLISELRKFSKFYNIEHKLFSICVAGLEHPGNSAEKLIEEAIFHLANPPAEHIAEKWRAPLSIIHSAV